MQRFALGFVAGMSLMLSALPVFGQSAFGAVETPQDGATVYGVVLVEGWILDMNAIDNIRVFVDGSYANTADINLPRADILAIFPTYANSPTANPGFISSVLASNYSNGAHTISVQATE